VWAVSDSLELRRRDPGTPSAALSLFYGTWWRVQDSNNRNDCVAALIKEQKEQREYKTQMVDIIEQTNETTRSCRTSGIDAPPQGFGDGPS